MVQQTILEYQPISPLFVSSISLGVKDLHIALMKSSLEDLRFLTRVLRAGSSL